MTTHDSHDGISRQTLAKLQQLSVLMDKAFTVPGTNIRFGYAAAKTRPLTSQGNTDEQAITRFYSGRNGADS
jgi:hypothetical protein